MAHWIPSWTVWGTRPPLRATCRYRLTQKTYDYTSSIAYAYENTTSRLKSVTDARQQITNYDYYIDNDLKQISYSGGNPLTPSVSSAYDPNYNRVVTMTDGTGATSYAYVPVGTRGALRVASVDGPLTNDTITYGYDEYGQVNNRSINGAANATSTVYDPLGRVSSVTNPLGAFNYLYVDVTPRLDHINYPNGQVAQYAYSRTLATNDCRKSGIRNRTVARFRSSIIPIMLLAIS